MWHELLCYLLRLFCIFFSLYFFFRSVHQSCFLPLFFFSLFLLHSFPLFICPLPFSPLISITFFLLLLPSLYHFSLSGYPRSFSCSLLLISISLSLFHFTPSPFLFFYSPFSISNMYSPGFQAPPPPPPVLCPQHQLLPRPLTQSRLPTVGWQQQVTAVDFPVMRETQRLKRTLTDLPFAIPVTTHSL